jgi:glycosyltransferase involved in cell wall biosynthesis
MTSICVDGFNLAIPKGSGIATYGRNLIEGLNGLGMETAVLYGPQSPVTRDRLLDTIALTDAPQPKGRPEKLKRWARTIGARFGQLARPVTPSSDVIWSQSGSGKPDVARLWAAHKLYDYAYRSQRAYGRFTPVRFNGAPRPDAVHWTCPMPLRAPGVVNLVTFHDLIPLKLPHTTGEDKQSYFAMCKEVASRADHMLAVSETTRQDVIQLLGVPEDRITTTYQSVSLAEDVAAETDDHTARYIENVFDLGWKDYFLYYGAIEPKKNVGRLVEAYLASGVDIPLVIVGGRSWLDGGEAVLIGSVVDGENKLRKGRIRKYDFLSAGMLTRLIRGARATLFPSLYEGFGLPVLESMLLGTAVLSSTAGSIPEVAGDAALLVDPYDIDAIKHAIIALAADDGLCDALVAKGRLRAPAFSPERHRERLKAVYAAQGLI